MQRRIDNGVVNREREKERKRERETERESVAKSLRLPFSLSLSPYSLIASFALLILFVFFSPLFAQQSRKAEVFRLGQEFELKINQEAAIEGEGLAVAFESVLHDGRCPEGVDCVWAGNAKIKVKLSRQKQTPGAIELNTGVSPKSSSYLGYEIKLVVLNPRPKANKAVDPKEYKATLIVTKK
jgi:hypothetical protein